MGKRFRELTQTATDSDFVEGNYFGVDTPSVTKKVPANLIAKQSSVAALQTKMNNISASIAPEFDPTRTEQTKYNAGEKVVNGGSLYEFINDHYGEWTGIDAVEVNVMSYVDTNRHEKLADLSFSEGAFVNASGIESSNSSYKVTGYVSLKPNGLRITSVFVKVMLNSSICICFYDKYKRFLSSSSVESNSNIIYENVLAAPAQAAFVRISCVKTYPDKLTYIGIGSISSLESSDSGVDDVRGIVKFDDGVNHVDYSAIAANRYVQADGTEKSFSGLNSTDFIPMEQGVAYNFDKLLTNYYAFYDAKYELVASYDTLGTLTSPFTIPVGAVYGRFGLVDNSVTNRWAVLWKGSVAKDEVKPYRPRFAGIAAVPSYKSVTDDEILDGSVSLSKIKGCSHSEDSNYLKESLWVDGYYIDSTGSYHASSGLLATKDIPLEAGKSYYNGNLVTGYYAFYAADGSVIEAHGNDASLTSPFTAPEGTSFGRFTTTTSRANGAWLSSRDEVPAPYYNTFSKDYRSLPLGDPDNPCEYTGKDICAFAKCLCIGDSLTAGTMNYDDGGSQAYVNITKNSYPSCLARMTGLDVTNKGNGGATSAEWYDLHKNEDLSGFDFAIIQLGVNDVIRYDTWGQTSEDAFDAIIAKLKDENKNIKIFVANILPLTWYASNSAYKAFSDALSEYVEGLNDEDVVLLDVHKYSHVRMSEAYNCGHLSGYGYWRLAADYIGYIGHYMNANKMQFREIQFIGTNYVYDT